MQVTIDWIDLAAFVGALQGLLLAGVLVAHKSNRAANRLLAALMVAFSIYLLWEVYYSAGLTRAYPHLFGISYPLPWVFGPLVYLYAVAASDRTRRFQMRDALHFVPVVVVVLVALPIYMMSGPDKVALYDRLRIGDAPTRIAVMSPFMYVSGLSYSVATVGYLRRHRRRVESAYSNTERVNLRWLLWLSGAAAAIWLLAVSITLLRFIPHVVQPRNDGLVALAVAILVYAIGYMGLRQPEIFRYDGPGERPAAENPPPPAEPSQTRYERSGLSDIEAAKLKSSLLSLMDTEHPYRDPDLTLPQLAEQLDTTPHKLSEVLNSELGKTFYDFINGYRVEDIRRRLAESASHNINVLALAMDAGFASKSTFNQAFKKLTGKTPSTFRKARAG